MIDWMPYLNEILGRELAQENNERARGEELLTIAAALVDKRPQADDRVRLLDWIADLDDVQQVFLLPELGRQLADPSVIVRKRLLTLLHEIAGGETAAKSIIDNTRELLDADAPTERRLNEILLALERLLLNERDIDLAMPLSALQFLRRPVFALTLLAGIGRALMSAPERQPLLIAMERFFADDQRIPLRGQLQQWLTDGPLFLRYLMVRFIGDTGCSPSERRASQALLDVYRTDQNPLVASTAIETFAQHIEPADLAAALALLREEFATFARRQLAFRWEALSADCDDRTGIRMLGVGVLRAFGSLALAHPSDSRPQKAILDILSAPVSTEHPLLDVSDARMPSELRERIFNAAVLLHGANMRVRVTVSRESRRTMAASFGVGSSLAISDPAKLLAQHPAAAHFWAEPVPNEQHFNTPRYWTYCLRSVVGEEDRRATTSLVAMMSPVLSPFVENPPPTNFSPLLQDRVNEEIDARGWFMEAACEAIAAILEKSIELHMPLDRWPLRSLFSYMADLGFGTMLARYTHQPTAIRDRLKNRVRSLFLNRLAHREVFDRLFSNDQINHFEADLLAQLSVASLRSLPSTTARHWLDGNIEILLRIVRSSARHATIRVPAALALAYGAAHIPRARQALESLVLPCRQVYKVPGGLRFASTEELGSLYIRETPPEVAWRFAAGEDQDGESRILFIFGEVLARWLTTGECDPADADRFAAACLGAKASLPAQARLRLLQAYAVRTKPLARNTLRLFHYLLRTSTGPELALYFSHRAESTDSRLLDDVFGQLVSVLSEDSVRHRSIGRRFDQTALADDLARRRIVLTLLAGYALSTLDFFRRYRDTRESQPHTIDTEMVIAASGQTLRTEGYFGDLLAVLRPVSVDGTTLAAEAGDIVTTFVHHPQPGTELACLARFHPMPRRALDLHTRQVATGVKQKLLEDQLATGTALVLARVAHTRPNNEYIVDLGASTEELNHLQSVIHKQILRLDDAVLIEISRLPGPQLFLTDGKFVLRHYSSGVVVKDLREKSSSVTALRDLESQGVNRRLVLRATVRQLRQHSDNVLRCELEIGFKRLMKNGSQRHPVAYVQSQNAPDEGSEVLVEPQSLRFEMIDLVQFMTRVIVHGAVDQTVVRGRIHWDRPASSAPRRWFGHIGPLQLPIPRRRLTGDLGTLYALDALPDEHPILEWISTNPILLRVTDGGQNFSIVDVPPQWRSHDLILAVLSNAVDTVTFLRYDQRASVLILEVHLRGEEMHGPRFLARSPIGILALLADGELFDLDGYPVRAEKLREGVRLSLIATMQHVRIDGRLETSGQGSTTGSPTPLLCIATEPDEINAEFSATFETDRTLRARIVSMDSELALELAEELPEGYPAPHLIYDGYLTGSVGTELELVIVQGTNPASEDFKVTVAPPRTSRVWLDQRNLTYEVRTLFDLHADTLLHGRKRLQADGKCLVRNLRVELDPLMHFLLPRSIDLREFVWTSTIPVLITKVEKRRPMKTAIPTEIIPFLDKDKHVAGVVVGVPQGQGIRRVEVRWLDGEPEPYDPDPAVSDAWMFDPGQERYSNGDVLRVGCDNDGPVIWHEPRSLYGTLIHEVMAFSTWAGMYMQAPAKRIHGTFIRGRLRNDERFLFVVEPAYLLAVPILGLSGVSLLDEAWPLDPVELTLNWIEVDGEREPIITIERTERGLLHARVDQPCTLEVRWHDFQADTYSCRFAAQDADGEFEIPVVIPAAALSQSQQRVVAKARPTPTRPVALDCIFGGYVLNVKRTARTDRKESVRLIFEPQFIEHAAATLNQKGMLEAALEASDGRIDDAIGNVVQIGMQENGELILGVELDSYRHTKPLLLPSGEQTWISHTGHYAKPGWSGKFTILRGVNGPIASLRRRRPISLEAWIEHARLGHSGGLIDGYRLLFFGILSEPQLVDCGLVKPGPEAPNTYTEQETNRKQLALFEIAPGSAFTASVDQLRLFGEPFDPQALRTGDIIEHFRLFHVDDEARRGLDLRHVIPDVRLEIESFNKKRGIFFGTIRLNEKNEAEIADLRGLHYSPHSLSGQRRGRWKFRLEALQGEQHGWIERLSDDEYIYFKFTRTDIQSGELFFRVLSPDEVFERSNLVYVQADHVTFHGRNLKLDVRPLNRLGKDGGQYFIPDTLYSERLGWLNTSSRTQSGIFLARVFDKNQTSPRTLEVKLSLRHNPFRRFETMLQGGPGQAIIKHPDRGQRRDRKVVEEDDLLLEISEGVNVKAPFRRIDWLNPHWKDVQPGDVIFFTPLVEGARIMVTNVVRSHRAYLERDSPATILTMLWSRPIARLEAVARGGPEATLNCSLIGLPLLKGVCRPVDENIGSTMPLPQVVVKPIDGEWVHLKDEPDSEIIVGHLEINDELRPKLSLDSKEQIAMDWSAVTFREAPFGELASHLEKLTFRNVAAIAVSDAKDTLATTPVLAKRNALGDLSLVSMSRWPFPVEHLIEQFPPRRELRTKANLHLQEFIVADAENDRLILEIAPGRFTELPAELIIPLHNTKLRNDLKFDLTRLRPGDSVALELVVPSAGADEFLPRFRIHSVSFGERRHFQTAFITPLQWDSNGSPLVGVRNGPLIAMPALDDHVIDLRLCASVSQRLILLRDSFKHYGQRLVLMGGFESSVLTEHGMRCFVNIGIQVPFNHGERVRLEPPSWLLGAGEKVPIQETPCPVRVLEAEFKGHNLSSFSYEAGPRQPRRMRIVSGRSNGFARSYELPRRGDSVLIYLAQSGNVCVAGFPSYEVNWIWNDSDPLRLHDPEQRRLVLHYLLASPDASIWSTVEAVDREQRLISLSRRVQIERSLPELGHVTSVRVLNALSNYRLLVDLGGLPWILNRDELSYGAPYLEELCVRDEQNGGLRGSTVEVVLKPEGRLSALAVYEELPSRCEIEAVVINCVPSGIMVINQGRRMFVPKGELAWCDLDANQIEVLFHPGDRILVSVTRDEAPSFSHVRTHAIRTELASLLRNSSEPVYVRRVYIDEDKRRALVRGRSNVTMELLLQEGESIDERICAYVRHIDSRRHRVELSLDETPSRVWNLPRVAQTGRDESATYAVDCLSNEVIKSSLEDLRIAIATGGTLAITAWAERQRQLEPSPRNLRLVIEKLHSILGNSNAWSSAGELPKVPRAEDAEITAFPSIWSQLRGVLTGRMETQDACPVACFAAGYSCLLDGRSRDAELYLRTAWADGNLRHHFDVGLSMARVEFLAPGGDRRGAHELLRSLIKSFFVDALHTLVPPLLEPEPLEALDSDYTAFAAAMTVGDLDALERLLIGKFGARNPNAARTRSNAVWFLLARTSTGPEFDHAVESFFDALRDEENIGLPVDGRLHVMAALLSFARGNVVKGWWHLDQLRPSAQQELQVAHFWRSFLYDEAWTADGLNATPIDRLLASLWSTWRQCRWRKEVDRSTFDALWEAFREAPVRWVFSTPGCRALPEPPTVHDELVRWAEEHGAEAALRPLLAERGLGGPVGD